MKVENETSYDTRVLRTIFCAVHVEAATRGNRGRLPYWKRARFVVAWRAKTSQDIHGDDVGGYAYLNSGRMRLSLPRDGISTARLAAVFYHELLHCYGFRHSDMGKADLYSDPEPWRQLVGSDGLNLDPFLLPQPIREAIKPTTEEKQIAEVGRLRANRKNWISKARRADTAIAKIDRRLKRLARDGHEVGELVEVKAAKKSRRRKAKK